MTFGVFIHRTDSIYDDIPSERYQFPKQYLARARECVGDWIIYLEPSKVKGTKGYFAVAKVQQIIADSEIEDMYFAIIEPGTYLDFGNPVPFREPKGIVERGLLNSSGKISGRAQAAVRSLSEEDFTRIIEYGLSQDNAILPRTESLISKNGLEESQETFTYMSTRERVDLLTSRTIRDRNFRKRVLLAYGERCAITGLRLINGKGRAEVEAAHIRPVEHNGPDIVNNGLALSGTAHWMFDRGLVGISDSLKIIVSRQSNDFEAIKSMINETGTVLGPIRALERPHPEFLKWHRENCFKS